MTTNTICNSSRAITPQRISATTFEHRRQVLLRQMLLHTCFGHPFAQVLVIIGLYDWADNIHYWTLPTRAKRRMKGVKPKFNPDKRLRSMDLVFTPLCSIARAFGFYRLADSLFRLGPHETATQLGACSYYYHEDPEEKPRRIVKQKADVDYEAKLKSLGYTISLVHRRGTSIRLPWVWVCPLGRRPTKQELRLIDLTGHRLKEDGEDEGLEFERIG